MQDRYVGDIGDFGKYGLLRSLSGLRADRDADSPLRLGVVWYLYPDEDHTADGKFTSYLADTPDNHSKYRACDPPLYDSLCQLVLGGNRSVAAVRHSGILPSDTAFHERRLFYTSGSSRSSREEIRETWVEDALEVTAGSGLVFFDPDNGISDPENGIAQRVNPWGAKGPKHVLVEELRRFSERGQSLVIYHHLGRHGTAVQQIERVSHSLQSELSPLCRLWSLRYRRGTSRAFFIVAQPRHEVVLGNRLMDLIDGPWGAGKHFELVG